MSITLPADAVFVLTRTKTGLTLETSAGSMTFDKSARVTMEATQDGVTFSSRAESEDAEVSDEGSSSERDEQEKKPIDAKRRGRVKPQRWTFGISSDSEDAPNEEKDDGWKTPKRRPKAKVPGAPRHSRSVPDDFECLLSGNVDLVNHQLEG